MFRESVGVWLCLIGIAGAVEPAAPTAVVGLSPHEAKNLANARQVTLGLPQAGEGYFSPDGQWIIYQAYPIGYPFYQIYLQKLDERTPRLISTGRGRTTCSYFSPDGKTLLFASSHIDPDIETTELKAREEAAAIQRRFVDETLKRPRIEEDKLAIQFLQ